MDLIIGNLRIPVEKDGLDEYIKSASRKLAIGAETIKCSRILSKTLDIGDKDQFYYDVSIVATVPDTFDPKDNFSVYTEKLKPARKAVNTKERPIIIGSGPAGMFAAIELVDRGIRPLVFERGRKIEERSADVQDFIRGRKLDSESNIQFGEGGAGSYSDGKLFSKPGSNSGYAEKVLDTFIRFGAPAEIAYAAKPHLGTDVLCRIVLNMRKHILEGGGEIHHGSKMTDLIVHGGKAAGVVINGAGEYSSPMVYLAVGHSARDTFEMLHAKGVILEQRPISVGMRIEHPVEIINLIRYGAKYRDFPGIGAATYSFNCNDRKARRIVTTFCMCPGGEVVNASSEQGMMVVNGMSYSRRDSPFSNAALVVSCHADDYGSAHPLAGVEFQRDIERRAFAAAGGSWEAPAQNLMDFLCGKISSTLNRNSFKMGTSPADMKGIFPEFVCESLAGAFNVWKTDYPLFVSEHAVLIGAETRTSSPVRIMRNERYESVNIGNLYPIGEGSGYTGGITSSAADALKAVEKSLSP